MSATDQLESLKAGLPELFQDRELHPEWDENYIILPIADPVALDDLEPDWSSPKKVDTDRIDLFVSLGVFSEFGNVD